MLQRILLLACLLSGCSALIYEIVWLRLFRYVIGSSALSQGVLLAGYMGGLALGSWLLPKFVSRNHHPFKVLFWLELSIGIFGLLSPFIFWNIDTLYVLGLDSGLSPLILRAGLCFGILLFPTALMGATLPVITRFLRNDNQPVARLSLLYSVNLFGAVIGTCLGGFLLLRYLGVFGAIGFAVAGNFLAAVLARSLGRRYAYHITRPAKKSSKSEQPLSRTLGWSLHLVVFFSGMSALGAQIIWTRQLSMMMGDTVFAFAMILAIFLVGLGGGAALAAAILRKYATPRALLITVQGLLVLALPLTSYLMFTITPDWQVNVRDPAISVGAIFWQDFLRNITTLFPATLLWGASFPVALAWLKSKDLDRSVASLYAMNTAGAILGALLATFWLVPAFGSAGGQRGLVIVAGVAALAALVVFWRKPDSKKNVAARSHLWLRILTFLVLVLGTTLAAREVTATPKGLIAYGRATQSWKMPRNPYVFWREGLVSSVAVQEWPQTSWQGLPLRQFHIGGKVVASNLHKDMRLQRLLGHFPALVHGEPKSVLIVGCGAGVTAGTFTNYPCIEKITICEIEPLACEAAKNHFSAENENIFSDPRTRIIFDDARHFLLTTNEQFDLITSDPIHPYVRGSAALYSREYHELCKRHLKPGGTVSQWVPLYEADEATVKSEIGTFMASYQGSSLWSSAPLGTGYDLVMLGEDGPSRMNLEQIRQRLEDWPEVKGSLQEVSINSVEDLMDAYVSQQRDLSEWLKDAQINSDWNFKLEYLAGLSLNVSDPDIIYHELVRFRRYPLNLFKVEGGLRDVPPLRR